MELANKNRYYTWTVLAIHTQLYIKQVFRGDLQAKPLLLFFRVLANFEILVYFASQSMSSFRLVWKNTMKCLFTTKYIIQFIITTLFLFASVHFSCNCNMTKAAFIKNEFPHALFYQTFQVYSKKWCRKKKVTNFTVRKYFLVQCTSIIFVSFTT